MIQELSRGEQFNTVNDKLDASERPVVMKFGGTSVGGARPIERVARIVEHFVRDDGRALIVVVSAVRGVTDRLVTICDNLAAHKVADALLGSEDILAKHSTIVGDLSLPTPLRERTDDEVLRLVSVLEQEARRSKLLSMDRRDLILSLGERLNVRIVAAKLLAKGVHAEVIDASEFLETDDNFGHANINFEKTHRYASNLFLSRLRDRIVPVVTGFIGATKDGKITTLGRQGSDYTATILARALNATEVWIWKDVDGVYTEDPRKNPDAKLIPQLTFFAANKVAKISEQMLFPETLKPLEGTDIVLRIKNTFNPVAEGTRISHR